LHYSNIEEIIEEYKGEVETEERETLTLYRLKFPLVEVGRNTWTVWKYKKDNIERSRVLSDLFVMYLMDTGQAGTFRINRSH
jgi:hypothetical protein